MSRSTGMCVSDEARFQNKKRSLVAALGNLQEVVTELRLHRTLNDADLGAENHLVKLFDHHAGTELSQATAFLA